MKVLYALLVFVPIAIATRLAGAPAIVVFAVSALAIVPLSGILGAATEAELELARLVCEVVGFEGEIITDTSKPDGTPRKLMSADKLRGMGWKPKISLREGLERTYRYYRNSL